MMSMIIGEQNRPIKSTVLITGGSGLIGRYLTSLLLENGYNVSCLSRSGIKPGKINVYKWDPERGKIDPDAFKEVDFIVNLAGANIGERRWTNKRKAEIIKSRSGSLKFLHETITEMGIPLKAVISASAAGIYGSQTSERIFNEGDSPAADFLGNVCRLWEGAADLFNASGIRTVKIRTGVVLEKNDSALSKLMKPAKFGFLVQAGTGNQYMPWIHIEDLCKIYLKAITDSTMHGSYNAVAPQHIKHKEFMQCLASVMKAVLFPVPVPAAILKIGLGQMSDVILKGSRVSSEKLIDAGYNFRFGNLEEALRDVIFNHALK